MKKIVTMLFMLVVSLSISNSLFAQAGSVGLNGSFTFSDITGAYAAIGVVGSPQLIELSATYTGSTETIPVRLLPKSGTSATNTITIRPSAGANGLTLTGSLNNGVIRFDTCKFVIVDGRPGGVTSTPANYLTVSNTLGTGTFNSAHAILFVGSQNCKAQFLNGNCVANIAGARGVFSIGGSVVTLTTSSGNVIANNVLTGAQRCIQDGGAGVFSVNDTIRNNDVSQYASIGIFTNVTTGLVVSNNRVHFTSAITTIATFLVGIQVQGNAGLTDGNEIDHLTSTNCTSFLHMANFGANNVFTNNNIHDPVPVAAGLTLLSGMQFSGTVATTFSGNQIHDFAANAAASFVIGLNFANNGTASDITTVSKNKIFNLSSTSTSNIRAMSCFPHSGNTLNLNNNFIAITQANNPVTAIFGILIGGSTTASIKYTSNVYFNSIRIGGVAIGGVAGATNSYGILRDNDSVGSVYNQKNNIVINERTTGDANTQIQIGGYVDNITGTLDVDYNTYWAADTLGGFAGGWRDTIYKNPALAAFKAYASPQESHTNFKNVTFVSSTDLHLAGASNGDAGLAGTPIAGITTDIDNQTRSTTYPYKGADEGSIPLQASLTLTMNFQAINPPPSINPQDTIIVELRSTAVGHALIDFAKGLGGSGIPTTFKFTNATDGVPYYIRVVHRNSIATWSAFTPSFSSAAASYDFTTDSTQAFGKNMIKIGTKWSNYTGDVNQDGSVGLTDIVAIFNDGSGFVTGPYVTTDLNWDTFVNLTDLLLAFNNNVNFISEKAPTPGPMSILNPVINNVSKETTVSNASTRLHISRPNTNVQNGNTVQQDR